MGILARMDRRPRAATLANPEPWLLEALGGLPSKSGQNVTPDTAMRCAAVYACVRVLAESVAQLPLLLYQASADGRGKERAILHPLYWLLRNQPNEWQTSFEFRELLMMHTLMRGNGYAYINRAGGQIRELLPLHPDRVTVRQDPATLAVSYQVRRDGREPITLQRRDVFHVRGMSTDGLTGLSVIAWGRETIGLAMATEEHGARMFSNAARPSGILSRPRELEPLSPEAAMNLVQSFTRAYSSDNAQRTALLEEGVTFSPVTLANDDMQFLQTRKFQKQEIASLFRVPPHMIADLERATFTNIESQGTDFVVYSIGPWIVRWEQAIARDLIADRRQGDLFAEFLVDGFLRGDIASRYSAYNQAVNGGWMSRNEVRVRENMNPVEGLDEFLVPLNMSGTEPTGDPSAAPDQTNTDNPDGGDS